jgi:hypothetical protein
LEAGHEVVGIDNFGKYGPIAKSYDGHPNYHFTQGDGKDAELLRHLIADCDHPVALRRGPIPTELSISRWPHHIATTRRMGPLRGDDSGRFTYSFAGTNDCVGYCL